MSIYSNVFVQALKNQRKLVEQQKNQHENKAKYRILKQTHDKKLAENLSFLSKTLDVINASTKNLRDVFKKSDVENGITQTPAIENLTGAQSLRDTLATMKRSENFFK